MLINWQRISKGGLQHRVQSLIWIEVESYRSVRVTLSTVTQKLPWRKQLIWEGTRELKSRTRDNQYNHKNAFIKVEVIKLLIYFLRDHTSGQ